MDELSIYNEVLTAEEIADHYNTGTGIHSNRMDTPAAGLAYPMPFADEFYIPVINVEDMPAQITVMNASGQVVHQVEVMVQGGMAHVKDVGKLLAGYYIYMLQLDGKTWVGKIVK